MDNPLQIVPQAETYKAQSNEAAYGPIADSYAQKYGIPTDMFRNIIRNASGFDPAYDSGNGGGGIANLNIKGVNSSDIGGSLDYVGNLMSSLYKSSGSWSAVEKLMTPDAEQVAQAQQTAKDNSWTGKISAFFKSAGWTILISAVGVLLILGSVWVIVNSSENK